MVRFFFLLISITFLLISWHFKFFVFVLIGGLFFLLFINTFFNYKKFFLIIISILIPVIFLEILYPYLSSKNSKNLSTYFDTNSGYSKRDYRDYIKGLGFIPRKGSYDSKKFSSDGDLIYDVVYNIDKDNFRKYMFKEKPLIHLFGGSFAFGEGLNENETLAYYLSKDHNLKTKSFGVHGYGAHQALFIIDKLKKSAVNGTNLVLTGPFHIRRSACKVSYSSGTPFYENNNGIAILKGNCNLSENFIEKILNKSNLSKLYYKILPRYGKNSDADILQYFSIIRGIKKESERNGSNLIIAYISTNESHFKNTSYSHNKFFQELSKIPDQIINVTLGKNYSLLEDKYYIHPLDKHPSAIANKERAALLAKLMYK